MSELARGWVDARLDELAEVRLGRQRSPKNHSGSRMRPYLRAANVRWSGLDLRDVKKMNFTEDESAVYELRPGDVLVAEASGSADEVGKPAVWRGEIDGCCFQNTLIRIRTFGSVPEYLLYFLLAEAQSGRIGRASPGVGIHHIGAARLAAWRVPVPPLAEQRRIVAAIEEHLTRLESADAEVRSTKARIDLLRRSILDAAIADGRDVALNDLLVRIEAGRSAGGPAPPARADEWGVIKVSAMTWGEFRPGENKRVAPDSVDPRHEIRAGDLLVSRANTTEYVGAAVLVRETPPRLVLSDKSLRLVTRDGVDREWLLYALLAPTTRRQISAVATGTSDSMRNISQEKLRGVRLRVPDVTQQRTIAAEISRQLAVGTDLAAAAESALRKSAALRRSILARAFRGELVSQDTSDEPSSALLERIAAERVACSAKTRKRRVRTPA